MQVKHHKRARGEGEKRRNERINETGSLARADHGGSASFNLGYFFFHDRRYFSESPESFSSPASNVGDVHSGGGNGAGDCGGSN